MFVIIHLFTVEKNEYSVLLQSSLVYVSSLQKLDKPHEETFSNDNIKCNFLWGEENEKKNNMGKEL